MTESESSNDTPRQGNRMGRFLSSAKDCMGRLPLFVSISIWVVIAIVAFLSAMSWLGRTPFWQLSLDSKTQAESIVKIALALVGGVGAVAYLVIKYQERQQAKRDEERAEHEEERAQNREKREEDRLVSAKMHDAVGQLGSDKALMRIEGVYALTDIADTYGGEYRQRVVGLLCGYLRSDREAYPIGADGRPMTDRPKSGDADKAVESEIIKVMRDHLRKERRTSNGEIRVRQLVDDDQLWCGCSFDLHGATFHEDVDLMDTTFVRGLNFNGSKFEGHANFKRAILKGYAVFIGTAFEGDANFSRAIFGGNADFSKATFEGDARLNEAIFGGDVDLSKTTFKRLMGFSGTTVKHTVDLSGTMFKGDADFSGTAFEGCADFKRTKFESRTQLIDATFKRHSGFIGTAFEGDAYFNGVTFTGIADFNGVTFTGIADFSGASIGKSSPVFEGCICNRRFRGANVYDWGPIPEGNDGLPVGAMWDGFPRR